MIEPTQSTARSGSTYSADMNDTSESTSAPATVEFVGAVAVIRLDDGKANALGHDMLGAVESALDQVEASDARALVILGREGKFSAGFDLKVMQSGPQEAQDLLRRGADLGIRLLDYPLPVILGSTGHALAMGGILLNCGDVRIGASGPFKIGLPEVRIGMPVPAFAVEICRARLSPRWFSRSLFLGLSHSPEEAAEAGYLDEVVPPQEVEARCMQIATDAAESVSTGAFGLTRGTMNGALLAQLREALDADVASFFIGE